MAATPQVTESSIFGVGSSTGTSGAPTSSLPISSNGRSSGGIGASLEGVTGIVVGDGLVWEPGVDGAILANKRAVIAGCLSLLCVGCEKVFWG